MSSVGLRASAAAGRDWLALRDRLLASPRFQRWALAFPPTRWIARRKARALFDLCAGFVYSQVLAACVQLDLFAILAEGPQDADAIGRRTGLDVAAARRLLEAARSLDLVGRRGADRYGLGSLGAALRGTPGVAAMVAHHRLLYADLADPVPLLRGQNGTQALARHWPYATDATAAALGPDSVGPYTALMGASQAMVAAEILDSYPVGRHRHLLDVGGGDGSFLAAVGARVPAVQLGLFDLPQVTEQARTRLAQAGLGQRVTLTGGNFRTDPLPRGADLLTLVRIVHDHDDDVVRSLLRATRVALAPGGTLLIAEPMAETPGADPVGHAYFGFYLLAMGSGRPRSAAELSRMVVDAGFTDVRTVATRMPLVTSVLTARAPA